MSCGKNFNEFKTFIQQSIQNVIFSEKENKNIETKFKENNYQKLVQLFSGTIK